MQEQIIDQDRSLIIACDLKNLDDLDKLVDQTHDIPRLGGYKLGFSLGLRYGIPQAVEIIKSHTSSKAIIYDNQKAGSDTMHTAEDFAEIMSDSGIDAAILFPFSGPRVQEKWTNQLRKKGVVPIIGAYMTHDGFIESEGGYISFHKVMEIYRNSAKVGVNNFVGPGRFPLIMQAIREIIELEGITPTFFSPGFGELGQGGSIEEMALAIGPRWHPIVGRDIIERNNMRSKALEYTQLI